MLPIIRTFFHYSFSVTTITIASFLLTSCCTICTVEQQDVDNLTIDKVGTIRASVVSVAPWDDYVDVLQPRFDMDSKAALAEAVPTTSIIIKARNDMLRGTLGVGLGSDVKTSTSTNTYSTDDTVSNSTTSETTETQSPGTLPTVSSVDAQPKESSIQEIGLKPESLGLEPKLRYMAAASLYQEVQMLNRYIKNAALRTGLVPYVVRLQLTLMPLKRNLPLDAYANMAFFVTDKNGEYKSTVVTPLVSTDSHEGIIASKTAQAIKQIGLSVRAPQQTSIGLDVGKTSEQSEDIAGRDINSTFSVARLSDNAIRVRLGAMQQGSGGLSMVPRTESVNLLLMIPKDNALAKDGSGRTIHVTTISELVSLCTGNKLQQKSGETEQADVEYLRSYLFDDVFDSESLSDSSFDKWWSYVVDNDWVKFASDVNITVCKNEQDFCDKKHYKYLDQLWVELSSLQPGYAVDALRFELPAKKTPVIFPKQTIVLNDDGKKQSVANIYYGGNLDADEMCGVLLVKKADVKSSKTTGMKSSAEKGDAGDWYTIAADSLLLEGGGRKATLVFPSLRTSGFVDGGLNGAAPEMKLRVATTSIQEKSTGVSGCWSYLVRDKIGNKNHDGARLFESGYVMYREKNAESKKNVGFSMSSSTQSIVIKKDGTGELDLYIEKSKAGPASKAIIRIQNANIVSVSVNRNDVPSAGSKFELTMVSSSKEYTVSFKLKNASPDEAVKVDAVNQDKVAHQQLSFKVKRID